MNNDEPMLLPTEPDCVKDIPRDSQEQFYSIVEQSDSKNDVSPSKNINQLLTESCKESLIPNQDQSNDNTLIPINNISKSQDNDNLLIPESQSHQQQSIIIEQPQQLNIIPPESCPNYEQQLYTSTNTFKQETEQIISHEQPYEQRNHEAKPTEQVFKFVNNKSVKDFNTSKPISKPNLKPALSLTRAKTPIQTKPNSSQVMLKKDQKENNISNINKMSTILSKSPIQKPVIQKVVKIPQQTQNSKVNDKIVAKNNVQKMKPQSQLQKVEKRPKLN